MQSWVDPDTVAETRSDDKEIPSSPNANDNSLPSFTHFFWFKARINNRRRPCKPKIVPFCH